MTTFDDLGLAEPILRAVAAEGYSHPTPIQAQGIPAVLTGRDLVGIAQTGTGKTAAFVLPILHRLAEENRRPAEKTAHALIVVPTRELAEQIGDSIRNYSRHMRVTHAVVIGGANPRTQAAKLARGVDIIVATPGRLLDHMNARVVSLTMVRQVVLDEADQMLDMGFIPAIRQIMAKVSAERQTLL
ncbi:MAG: DEAD/DEAH box helicase, partial [Alphaproteobacteria bacterium]|nr:DEAD/DEAH box helicase [Alphaproteobacteria bacterium]